MNCLILKEVIMDLAQLVNDMKKEQFCEAIIPPVFGVICGILFMSYLIYVLYEFLK